MKKYHYTEDHFIIF